MQTPYSVKMTKENLMEKLTDKRSAKTTGSSREGQDSRGGDSMLELVRQTSVSNIEVQKFNDKTDFDIQANPSIVWDELNNFNDDYFESKMTLECNLEKQYIKATMPGEAGNDSNDDLVLKIKFFDL